MEEEYKQKEFRLQIRLLKQRRKENPEKSDWRAKFSTEQKEELKIGTYIWRTPKYANLLESSQLN